MSTKVVKSNREKTREMTLLAMFIAIIAVLGLVPSGLGSSSLGFIKLGPNIEATIVHIPVMIGGAMLGRKMGFYLGTAFGIVSLIAAFIYSSPFFIYPWVSVLPRMIFGLVIYDVVQFFLKIIKIRYLALVISFIVLSLIHTALVLPLLWTSFTMVMGYASLKEAFVPYITFLVTYFVFVSALVEAGIAGVLGGTIVLRLSLRSDRDEEEAEAGE